MDKLVVRKATREDIQAFSNVTDFPTVKGVVGELNGKIIGFGGLARHRGRWYAFCDLIPEARKFKITIARAAIRVFEEARRDGVKFVYAEMDQNEPTAPAWLARLGFHLDPRSSYLFRWRP
jgi:hypothetical protein